MYENLIRSIPWGDFWEPVTNKQKCIKWTVILLTLSLGISIILMDLDDMQTYEYARKNPIIVEAERTVEEAHYWLTGGPYYEIYVSYSYDGVMYEDVFYRTSKNPGIRWDGVDTLMVAVAPNDPGVPIRNMFNAAPILFGVVLFALGLSMLVYGIAIEFSSFRQWRVRQANKPGFFSRPYGKSTKYTANPDYLKDFVLIFVPITFISLIILGFSFPYTFSN